MSSLEDLNFDGKTLTRPDGLAGSLPSLAAGVSSEATGGTTSITNPITESKPATAVTSESLADILFANKTSFTDTVQGYRMGIDSADAKFKFVMGSSGVTLDFGVTNAGVLHFNLPTGGASSNAIFITAAGNNTYPAIDIRRSVGTGSGIYIDVSSPSGYGLDILQSSNTPAIHVISDGSGSSVVPLQLENQTATSTNYYKTINLRGGSAPAVSLSQWAADDASPDGTLTGEKGDFCQSSNGKAYINTDASTAWSELAFASAASTDYRDWRYPDTPIQTSTVSITKGITSAASYTVPSGKRLYIYSVRTQGAVALLIDSKTIIRPGTYADYWQARTGSGTYSSNQLHNPLIVEEDKVISVGSSQVDIMGFLVPTLNADITVVNSNVSSAAKYTVTNGKMLVLLNACTADTIIMSATASGGAKFDLGSNINNSGGWVLGQPFFFYAGDVLETNSATADDGTINGYEITM